jgi:hypothetical protein
MGVAVAACAAPRAENVGMPCQARVIVGFLGGANNDSIAAVAIASDTRLTVVEQLLPDLYVLDLAASGDSACAAALERLRADRHVRSAELDARRAPNDGG